MNIRPATRCFPCLLLVLGAWAAQAQPRPAASAPPPPPPPPPQLNSSDLVFRQGNWYVVRSVRGRGNQVVCTGFHQEEGDVQLSKDWLILKSPGTPQKIVVRVDDERAPSARPPGAYEKQLGAVVLGSDAVRKMQAARKVTFDVAWRDERTNKEGKQAASVRLPGLAEAMANIQAGCPEPAQPIAVCNSGMRAKMHGAGVTPSQVQKICN
jgi:hypothetical protein